MGIYLFSIFSAKPTVSISSHCRLVSLPIGSQSAHRTAHGAEPRMTFPLPLQASTKVPVSDQAMIPLFIFKSIHFSKTIQQAQYWLSTDMYLNSKCESRDVSTTPSLPHLSFL